MLRFSVIVALAGAALLLLGLAFQDSMIYFPSRYAEPDELRRAAAAGFEPWRAANAEIVGWRRPQPAASARLIVFHGNAGSALDRERYAEAFAPHGWEVSIFEYPGYGARHGRPGKSAFLEAARAALADLDSSDIRPIALLGESIGSGTVCALLERNPEHVLGAVLVVPFARLAEVAWNHYGPMALILRDRFDNIATLRSCRLPVAFLVAPADEVVGAAQGRKLHDSYSGPKVLIEPPGSSHNAFPLGPEAEWVRATDAFLRHRSGGTLTP